MWYPDAMLLWKELEEAPPVRISVAHYLGYKKKAPFVKKPIEDSEFIGIQMAMGVPAGKMPQLFKDSIRWAEEQKKKMGVVH
jgi:hypothetical protein